MQIQSEHGTCDLSPTFEADLLFHMARDNAKIALDFLDAGLHANAMCHLESALAQLRQVQSILETSTPKIVLDLRLDQPDPSNAPDFENFKSTISAP